MISPSSVDGLGDRGVPNCHLFGTFEGPHGRANLFPFRFARDSLPDAIERGGQTNKTSGTAILKVVSKEQNASLEPHALHPLVGVFPRDDAGRDINGLR
jgi:hypothetical protein